MFQKEQHAMRNIMRSYVFFLIASIVGAVLMNPNVQAYMMGPYHGQSSQNPSGFNGGMNPGLHMSGTYDMNNMMNEVYPELLQAWPHASMWQGEDGAIRIQPEPQGPVYTYLVPMEGWSGSQGTGPYNMHFDSGGFQAVTSTGSYWGHPAPYDPVGFTQTIQSVLNTPVDITYQTDGAAFFQLPGGNQGVCLGASALAANVPGAEPGIDAAQPGSMYSNMMFNYGGGYRQDFHPAFMHSSEIMNALTNMPGMGSVQIGADGVITGLFHDGAATHSIALHPAMIYETGSLQTGPGFGYGAQAGWWFTYSGGERQPFRVYPDE
jgi:hypothetical protein